jgi:DNA-directed RNA polymerase subunit RPC12/RpoP
MEPKNIVALCMECGFQYVTAHDSWEERKNSCPNCEGSKAQLLSERVNE